MDAFLKVAKPLLSTLMLIMLISNSPAALSLTLSSDINNDAYRNEIVSKVSEDLGLADTVLNTELKAFEERMNNNNEVSEIHECYSRILGALKNYENSNDNAGVELCRQLLSELSDPSQINQGQHNTCAVAALESYLCAKDPSLVCKTVIAAKSGEFTVSDGSKIQMPPENIAPDRDARCYRPNTPFRSYSSQLFQVAAVNAFWQTQTKDPRGVKVPKGSIMYMQDYCVGRCFPGDTSERLFIRWSADVTEFIVTEGFFPCSGPCLQAPAIDQAYRLLGGDVAEPVVLVNKRRHVGRSVEEFAKEQDLAAILLRVKNSAAFPAIVSVSLSSKTFCPTPRLALAQNAVRKPGPEKWHVVCINSYDEKTGSVSVDNFWGPYSDLKAERSIPLSELYVSTCPQS
ncbi:MAG: hypothetical protein K2X27_05820 [Candidatus Obscuribacterales bacterium]|nr:hypothetical protein [Candidatus Obscuribacterales bacterium]